MTEPCLKCRTEIDAGAERCPACGYEPASEHTIARVLTFLIAWPVFLFSVLMVVLIPIVTLGSSFSLSGAVVLLAVFGPIAAGSGAYLYKLHRFSDRTPTANPA